ncbi:MAG TPA: dUTP diphosphatase [Atopostipes sp.]|nr:dUTP diphosphatase [Atopostipes sp.]
MNLQTLIDMQRNLDNRIREEKGLKDADLVANTYVALQVELAEFANEARWFKHWSKDQEPNIIYCHACNGYGYFDSAYQEACGYCHATGIQENPLLEEYIDSLHFFLSLAIQKGWEDALWIYEEQLDPEEIDGELSEWYLEMIYFLNNSAIRIYDNESSENITGFPPNQYAFRMAWILFLNIGMNGFHFTEEQIEQAYIDKNKVNHERQENGY